jgi:multiple sugar transport system permease protein
MSMVAAAGWRGRERALGSRSQGFRAAQYGFLALAVVFALGPIAWGLSTSLKTPAEINALPPTWIPHDVTLANYVESVLSERFLRHVINTVLVVLACLVVALGLSAHAAYAAARFTFRSNGLILVLMWATIMIPGIAIVVPLYLMAIWTSLYDTLWALILVYSAWLVPTLVWLLRGFVAAVPVELEEAARIDGCSRLTAFYRITLPLLRPGLLAGSVLVFTLVWNEFLIAYSLVLSNESRLVQVGIYFFITEVGIKWGPLTAAAMGAILPVVAAYAFLQRAFIQGLSAGAVKG